MLIDRAVVEVRSGNGGDGHISFLHDKNTEWGGPDGGNGGDGGSVYFLAKNNLNTLFPFRHSPLLSAEDGEKGMKKLMAGKRGSDLIVEVPTGTVVIDERDGHVLADLDEPGKRPSSPKAAAGGGVTPPTSRAAGGFPGSPKTARKASASASSSSSR